MLRMDQVHVIRHKVLIEGQSIRRVAREMGLSRITVRKYLERPEPGPRRYKPRARPVWERVIVVGPWTPGTQLVVQSGQPPLLVAAPPMADHRSADPAAARHFPIGPTLARQQNDPSAPHQRVGHALRAHQGAQLFAVRIVDHQRRVRSAHPPHLAHHPSRFCARCKVINRTLH